jgi:hypothetical protein
VCPQWLARFEAVNLDKSIADVVEMRDAADQLTAALHLGDDAVRSAGECGRVCLSCVRERVCVCGGGGGGGPRGGGGPPNHPPPHAGQRAHERTHADTHARAHTHVILILP